MNGPRNAPAQQGPQQSHGIGPAVSTIDRLRRRSEFLAVGEGRRFHTERMTAQGRLRPEPDLSGSGGLRVGFTITKKVGHATERNRIRRRLRAAVSAIAPVAPSVAADVVLVARRPALSATFEALKTDLVRALPIVTKPQDPNRQPPARSAGGRGRSKPGKAGGHAASTGPTPGARLPNSHDGTPDGQ